MPNSYSTFNPSHTYFSKTDSTSVSTSFSHTPPSKTLKPSFTPIVQPRELPRQRLPESFNLVTALPTAFSLRSDSSVSLCRARMENRNVVLRVLNGETVQLSLNVMEMCLQLLKKTLNCRICRIFTPDFQFMASAFVFTNTTLPFLSSPDSADATERHNFLSFASFLSQLGPHPFLPELLGVISLRAPLVTVVEELENRDLLSFLWRCRQVGRCELLPRLNYSSVL